MIQPTVSQIDLIAEKCADIKPLVVISCITYNHEPYLRDALEGFVMQKTDFPFVAIVHDDASTDATASVLREYAEKYPDIILPIYETENQYSKHDGSLGLIMRQARDATGAKYIALCEGDDYWTDPNKLQKQVDFLESHPDYSLCFHNAKVLMANGIEKYDCSAMDLTRDYSADEILDKWLIPTASAVYKKENIENDPVRRNPNFKYGDNILFLTATKHGKIYGINEYWSVYRKNPTSVTVRLQGKEWLNMDIIHFSEIDKTFKDVVSRHIRKKALAERYYTLIQYEKQNIISCFRILLKGILHASPEIFSYVYRTIKRKINR